MSLTKRIPPEKARAGNRKRWEELTPVHLEAYGVDRFLAGGRWLPVRILDEVGDVQNLDLLHLQCHFGLDTLAWARRGARVTGVDFSPAAISAAQALAAKASLPARFVCSDIYDLPEHLDGLFDVVFTSIGVLCWLNDLEGWARVIAHFLKPGGFFYIMEGHPFRYVFVDDGSWKLFLPYFHQNDPYFWDDDWPDYMDEDYIVKNPSYEWQWTISDIINALLGAGLRLVFFNEFGALEDPVYPEMKPRQDGLYTLPDMPVDLPVVFSLKAVKPG